jgi:Dolichyl-phosphate-mannose-protein mannosyltransferase
MKLDRAVPLVVLVIVLGVGFAIMDALPVGVLHDDGMYVILAKSLATGHGYRWLNVPGTPPATHFPPGYPAFLAALWLIFPKFPGNVAVFKIANACFLALAAAGFSIFATRRLRMRPVPAGALALVASIGIPLLVLSTRVMSEPLFLAMLIPILLLAERVADGERRAAHLLLLGLAAGAATLVRSHGITIVAGILIVLVVDRRWRDAALATGAAAAVILPWQLWSRVNVGFVPVAMRGNYESYAAWLVTGFREEGFGLLAKTIGHTAPEMAGMFSMFAALSMPTMVRTLVLVIFFALAAAGFWRLWRLARVTAVFVCLYMAIVLAWPFFPARFVWGIWPFVLALPVLGFMEARELSPGRSLAGVTRGAAMAGFLALIVGYGAYTVRGVQGRWWSSIARSKAISIRPMVLWARDHSKPTDVISSSAESMIYLYGERYSVPAVAFTVRDYFHPQSVEESRTMVREIVAAYDVSAVIVIADDSLRAALQSLSQRTPPELVLSDTIADGVVFTPPRR